MLLEQIIVSLSLSYDLEVTFCCVVGLRVPLSRDLR